ncbi:MAG: GLPGLI family protein [Bacteroidales bacterium]|nr:GLPGLI family protein [Bacteroidales bacterium]
MKKSFFYLSTLTFLFLLFAVSSFARDQETDASEQEIKGGTVKYEQITRFNWNFKPTGNARKDNWFANLPRSQTKAKVLYFNSQYSIYEEDLTAENVALDPRQQGMLDRMALGQPPKPELKKIFVDLKKNKKTELVELMTRLFLIENKIDSRAWKPGGNQRKIQGYICQEATMKRGKETITAWFTSNIPISIGPDNYGGLPGLILAIDINGENLILATSVNLTLPPDGFISKPKEGKKIRQEVFNTIVAEKVEEYNEAQKNKSAVKRAR